MNAEIESLRQGSVCFVIVSTREASLLTVFLFVLVWMLYKLKNCCVLFSVLSFPTPVFDFCFKQTYHLFHGYITWLTVKGSVAPLDTDHLGLRAFRMNGRSCGMSLHRPSRNPQGPGLLSGQHTPPIRAHSGAPGPSSCASLPSPAIGSPANSLHLRMSSGAGIAAQSDVALSPIHLPALSPRRQLLTNGKPQFPATQGRGLAASLTVKPKQQEFGDPFSPNPEKGRIVILKSFKNGIKFYLPHVFSLPASSVENMFKLTSESKFTVSCLVRGWLCSCVWMLGTSVWPLRMWSGEAGKAEGSASKGNRGRRWGRSSGARRWSLSSAYMWLCLGFWE